MAREETDRDPVEMLAADFVERQRRGESPSVAEYAEKHPECADGIRELFPTIAAVEGLKVRKERPPGGHATMGGVKLKRLGDFRIIREIGRGGMGIVYEAEQESLGRRVAMKVLPRQLVIDAGYLRRFKREARIAAGLHHTNIVPVFGVGEHDGFHYYVMQYIRGVGLDEIVARLSQISHADPGDGKSESNATGTAGTRFRKIDGIISRLLSQAQAKESSPRGLGANGPSAGPHYWRAVARIGLEAADALHYAHSRGTLHRDIKPSNLIVDEQGVVWIADFGLAKALQSEDVTRTAEITGTLRYMAPEQFQGTADARSDISALGLTLYELLTLRPAFEDAEGSSLVRRITQGKTVAPRKIDRRIPRDLEAIVLKAMARDPDRRYQTSDAFADDLERFIEGRPIRARKATAVESLWRWCRRNRAAAALTGVTLFLIVLVAVVATVGYVRTTNALAGEERQREKAEANTELAIEALDRIFDRFSPGPTVARSELTVEGVEEGGIEIPSAPVLSKEAAALLEDMLTFYDRLASQASDEIELHQKVAEANRRVGDIRQHLGQQDEAIAAYRRAIDMYRALGRRTSREADLDVEIARVHNELGRLYRSMRRLSDARGSHVEALAILEPLLPDGSARPEIRYELARTHYFLGTRNRPEPGPEPHGPEFDSPPPDAPGPGGPGFGPPPGRGGQGRPRGPGAPGPPPWRQPRDRGSEPPPFGRGPPGRHAAPPDAGPSPPGKETGDQRGEDDHLAKAVALLGELVEEHPSNPSYRRMLALCHRERFPGLAGHDWEAAVRALDRASAVLERLVGDFPRAPEYRYDLSETYAMVDPHGPFRSPYTPSVVEQRYRKALGIAEKLVAEHPHIPKYLASQAHLHHKLGTALRREQRLDEAEEQYRRAAAASASLMNQFPDALHHKVWLAVFRGSLADMLLRRGQTGQARLLLEGATAMLTELVNSAPEMWFVHGLLAHNYRTIAALLLQSGQEDPAAQARRKAAEHIELMEDRLHTGEVRQAPDATGPPGSS